MKRLTIRTRLTLYYTGILAGTLLVLATVGYGLLMRSLWQDVDATLDGVAKAMARSARPPSAAAVPPDVQEMLRRFYGSEFADRFFQFYDPGGHVDPRWPSQRGVPPTVSANALRNAAEGYATFETMSGASPPVRVMTFPILAGGRLANVLQVGMSLEGLYRASRIYLWIVAALVPLALILAGGGGWLLARRALLPVDRMAQAARRIEAENLGQRLEGAEANDELGRLARTLNEMLARIETGFAQVRRFSADASHELRTPLTILRGELEVALRNAREPAEYRRVIESGLEEVGRLARLVDDLLLLARADAGALRLDAGPVELDQLLEETAKQGEILGAARGVSVRLQYLEPLIVQGDGHRLRQVLLNLVDNAVKYTPAGGRVDLALRQLDGDSGAPAPRQPAAPPDLPVARPPDGSPVAWAEIAVQDTGIGIPAEALPRIFERFYRVDEAREGGGTGLGLCIAKSIVEGHGGRIEVQSQPDTGSTFRLLLPLTGR